MPLRRLFRHFIGLHIDQVTVTDTAITFLVRRTATTACCPSCRHRSQRVHSRYQRQVRDESIGGRCVTVHFVVRRFRCANARCPRRTFAEQAPRLAPRYAHHSTPLRTTWQHIGLALGGRPGARLCQQLHCPSSRTTLLRQVQALPLPEVTTPRVLGVDDWALKKGRTYGTILVDHQQHRPIDLLPDRTSETLAAWLHAHPGVEIVTRDRAGAYAEGIRRGAPGADQVADHWHLLGNLRGALERLLSRHAAAVRAAAVEARREQDVGGQPGDSPLVPPLSVARPTRSQREAQERRERRVGRYDEVRQLHDQGRSARQIARTLHLARNTVRRFLRAESFPERQPRPPRRTLLTPHEPYLRKRWAVGCHSATVLWREVQARGYRGGYSSFAGHLRAWRLASGSRAAIPTRTSPPVSVRQASWFLLRPAEDLTPDEQGFVTRLTEHCTDAYVAQHLAQLFTVIAREADVRALDGWLNLADHSAVPELRGFARGLRLDGAAVRNMVRLPWSNGQAEGQVNRLKALKRQMYGRAGLPLLKRRFLLAA